METKNAIIKNWGISTADHGCLTMSLDLDYGGGGQGFGGYKLGETRSVFKNEHGNYCAHFISRVMEIADVTELNHLPGKTIRIKADRTKIYEIGHIVKDIWFNPSKEFKHE